MYVPPRATEKQDGGIGGAGTKKKQQPTLAATPSLGKPQNLYNPCRNPNNNKVYHKNATSTVGT